MFINHGCLAKSSSWPASKFTDDSEIEGGGIPVHGIEAHIAKRTVSQKDLVITSVCTPVLTHQSEFHFPIFFKRIRCGQT